MSDTVPAIRPTQFESDTIGHLSRSVNMFRGEVNVTKTIAALPGRPNDSTLAVSVQMICDSGVIQDALTWNLDAPTGILGLGWTIQRDRIVAESQGALSSAALSYTIEFDGTSTALIEDDAPWLRATLSEEATSTLSAGAAVAPIVVQELAAQGLALGATATASGGGGSFVITDGEQGRVFEVEVSSGTGSVYDGGVSYQLQSYQQWRVIYYPTFERWEITIETGEVRSYGGGVGQTAQGYATSAGNSVEWAVTWGNAGGNWAGPSQSTAAQVQYARAWNLSARRDRWGSQVSYGYNEFPRGGDGLLGNNCEQLVGAGGLPYTKACYPTSITDIYGRTITFAYGNKSFTADVQEYGDPHKALDVASAPETPPDNLGTPNAYQDRYETLYLQQVNVANESGAPLYSVLFTYHAPQAVSALSGALQVTAAKRYLATVTEVNPDGQALPGYSYQYCLDGPNYGAIETMVYPQGGTATWTYAAGVDLCQRAQTVTAPSSLGANAQPFVWFGEDFVVSVWVAQSGAAMTLDVYTWVGQWIQWSAGIIYDDPSTPVTVGSLQAVVNQVSFAIAFQTGASSTEILLFARNPSMPTAWSFDPSTDAVTISGTGTTLDGGTSFIVATTQPESGGGALYVFTWSWKTSSWSGLDGPASTATSPIYALALNELYLSAVPSEQGTVVSIYYVDAAATWHAGGQTTLSQTTGFNDGHAVMWDAGPSCAALTFAQDSVGDQYTVALLRWDTSYDFCAAATFTDQQGEPIDASQGMPWPPLPDVVGNGLVGVRQNLFRFDGGAWTAQSFPRSTTTVGWLAFAYGDDFAVQVINDQSDAETSVLAYDPTAPGFPSAPLAVTTPLPSGDIDQIGWPSASGGDFFVARNALFYRGSSTSWQDAVASSVFPLPTSVGTQTVASQTIANGAPEYLAYLMTSDDPTQNAVQLLVLQNGGVLTPTPAALSTTSYTSPIVTPPGQAPIGPSTIVTWPASTLGFTAAQQYTLYRYAGQAISGPITDYPVSLLSIDDGFGSTYQTAYEFSAANAACDPTGQIVKYYQSVAYRGASSAATSTYGRTVYSYQNGFLPGGMYSMLDGLLSQTLEIAGAIAFTTQLSDALGLDPGATPNQPPSPVPAGLAGAFSSAGLALGEGATVQYVQVDGFYTYWAVVDPGSGALFNIDYNGNPDDPAGVRVFSGAPVTSSTLGWQVFTARNSSPTTPDATPLPLHGGYARPAWKIDRKDGVPLQTTMSYLPPGFAAPFHGGVVSSAYSFPNGAGATEAHVDGSTYACEISPLAAALNLLTQVAATRRTVQAASGPTVTIESTATTWSGWTQATGAGLTVLAPAQSFSWCGDPSGADTGVFPFGGTPDPSLWRLRSTVNVMSDAGLTLESTDASGVRHATLYDAAGQVPCAIVSNASFSLGQAAFASFEAYEDISAWALGGGAAPSAGDAWAGAQCLSLPEGASASLTLTPDPTRIALFSVWSKAPAGAWIAAGSGWTLTVLAGGEPVGDPIALPFSDTGGAWAFASAAVDLPSILPAGATDVTLTIAASNQSAAAIEVDDVVLMPLTTKLAARTYDPVFKLSLAKMDGTGKTWRQIRDPFMRVIGGTGPDGAPASLQLTYLSLDGNPGGFSAADPNASLAVRALGGGTYQTFRDGAGWTADWTASDASAFSASGGVLAHASTSSSATLTAAAAPPAGAMALYFEAVPLGGGPLALGDDLAISLGSSATFILSASTGQWALTLGGSAVPALATFQGPLRWVLVMQIGGYLTLHANGQLMFSVQATSAGAPAIATGANAIGIANLTLLAGPSAMIRYSDATGAARQAQTLTAEDYVVNQTIRDGRGAPIARTKAAPGLFGGGASVPVPAYRPSFVDVGSFLAGLGGAATMQGDVASYYDGTGDTNDQGYPYTRTVLEASSLVRPLELGFPGAAMAIVDHDSTSPADRATVQFTYGMNGTAAVPYLDLPAGAYQVGTRTSALKVGSTTVLDASRNVVARFSTNGGASVVNTTGPTYGNGSTSVAVVEPDAFTLGSAGLTETSVTTALGQVTSQRSPDAGSTSFLYDAGGRVRFSQDAAAAAAGYAVYFTWDALGRPLSRGVVTCASFADLAPYVDASPWPEGQTAVTYTQQRVHAWDGDGTDPNALGNLTATSAVTGSGDSAITVVDAYTWTALGLLGSRTTTVALPSGPQSFTTSYDFDPAGRMTSITYPTAEGIGFTGVQYTYDGCDRILQITDDQGTTFAAYAYNAMGKPIRTALGAGGVSGSCTYDSAGRLLGTTFASSSATFSSSLTYNQDSTIAGIAETLTPSIDGFNASVSYTYDDLGRLLVAADEDGGRSLTLSFTTPSNVTNQNGNIQSITNGAGTTTLTYASGSNRVASMQIGGGAAAFDPVYLDNGLVSSHESGAGKLAFTYVPGTTLPASITGGAATLSFAYNAAGYRVVKQVGDATELRVQGGASGPLLTIAADGTPTAWIYSPFGLVGMATSGARYAVATDYLLSPRVVFDASGGVAAAYAEDALGNPVVTSEPAPGFVPFLFTGQEYDPEIDLYNFNARVYDPGIGRFLAPDPAAQYPSSYSYVGNQFTALVDPSGQMSAAGEAAIDTLLLVVLVAAVVATGGWASVAVPAAIAESGLGAGMLVGAGIGALGGAVSNAAFQGLYYTIETPPGSWKASDFFEESGAAALGGAVGGAVGGALSPALGALWDAAAARLASAGGDAIIDEAAPVLANGARVDDAPAGDAPNENPDRDPAPPRAQAQADTSAQDSKPTLGKSLARNVTVEAIAGAANGAARGVVQYPLQNLILKQPAGQDLGYWVCRSTLFGAAFGAVAGTITAFNEVNQYGARMMSSIKSAFSGEPLWYAVAGLGGAVLTGSIGAGFYAYTASVNPYPQN